MSEDFGIAVDDRITLVIEDSFYNYNRSRKSYTAWMQIDGKNVGMLRYLIGGSEGDYPSVCDIEIRDTHRGQKLGIKLINLVEKFIIDTKLYTSGGFTPEGYNAFAGVIPVYPYMEKEELSVKFRSMNFVHDWDAYQLEH